MEKIIEVKILSHSKLISERNDWPQFSGESGEFFSIMTSVFKFLVLFNKDFCSLTLSRV